MTDGELMSEIANAYSQCPRFDQSEFYQDPSAATVASRRLILRDFVLRHLLNEEAVEAAMEELEEILSDEAELEARHYFEQGYRMGRAAK